MKSKEIYIVTVSGKTIHATTRQHSAMNYAIGVSSTGRTATVSKVCQELIESEELWTFEPIKKREKLRA